MICVVQPQGLPVSKTTVNCTMSSPPKLYFRNDKSLRVFAVCAGSLPHARRDSGHIRYSSVQRVAEVVQNCSQITDSISYASFRFGTILECASGRSAAIIQCFSGATSHEAPSLDCLLYGLQLAVRTYDVYTIAGSTVSLLSPPASPP